MISPDQFDFIPGIWVRVTGRVHTSRVASLLALDVQVDPSVYEHGATTEYRTVTLLLPWDFRATQREAPPSYYVVRDILGDILYHAGYSGPEVRAFYRFMARCRDTADLAIGLGTWIENKPARIIPVAEGPAESGVRRRVYASLLHPSTRALPAPPTLSPQGPYDAPSSKG